jgi:hypothetical protein
MRPSLRKLFATAAALTALVALGPAGAAATTTPAPGYEQFAGCPHPGENPLIVTCYRSTVSSGMFQMGNLELSLLPTTLSGGMTAGGTFSSSPKGGLQQVKLTVPGGVIGLTGFTWLAEFFSAEALAAKAVFELTAAPSDPLADPVTMPVRIHLINSILGNNCYLGSVKTPILLHLTTGTTSPPPPNSPISGAAGTSSTTLPAEINDLSGAQHVDNSFVGEGANGCVLTLFGFPPIGINKEIDEQKELPSAAGTNTTIQNFSSEDAAAATVYP